MFIDTHVHLNDKNLILNIDKIIEDAKRVGVSKMIVVGYDLKTSKKALDIALSYPNVYASIGFHPTEANNLTDNDYLWLEAEAKNDRVIAIGECGFDFHWKTTSKEEQMESFIKQIAIAKRINKPLIIHSRDAMQLTYDILVQEKASVVGGVMHSYSGSKEMVNDFIKENFYIGIGGPVTFLNAKAPKEVVRNIDLNYLLSETDAPYLSPHPFRGKTNTPVNIPIIVSEMAKLRAMKIDDLAKIIMENARRLFSI